MGQTAAAVQADVGSRTEFREGVVSLPGGLDLEHGGRIRPCRVAYRLFGAGDGPVVAVMGGISADRNACAPPRARPAGWWPGIVGHGRAVDTRRFRVLTFDWVGGPGASTGPGGGGPGLLRVTPGDQARALVTLAAVLGLPRLEAVVGASYGGAVALALAAAHPRAARRALVIGAAHRSHPMATALRVVQRRIVRLARRSGRPDDGLALARAVAMTTYRTDREFEGRFASPPTVHGDEVRFPVEDYLDHHGRTFLERFTPEAFLCLNESLDLHRVDPSRVAVPLTLVSVDPDAIAPRWQMQELHRLLGPGHELVEVGSVRGHDAFLTDVELFDGIVRRFLDRPRRTGGDR